MIESLTATGVPGAPGTPVAPVPVVVAWSAKLPDSVWLATVSVAPTATMLRNGPAGTFSETVVPPTTRLSLTAFEPVLTETVKVPPSETVELRVESSAIVAVRVPATPPPAISSSPEMFVALTTPPARLSEPFDTPTLMTVAPDAFVACWTAMLPLNVWPRIVSVAFVAWISTYGPAGRPCAAAFVVLMASANVPDSAIPGTLASATLTAIEPAIPAEVITKPPVPTWVAVRIGEAVVPPKAAVRFASWTCSEPG